MRFTFSLRTKLVILSAIPLLCAAGLGAFLTYQRIKELDEFVAFREAMDLANSLAVVNEINNMEMGNAWCWTGTAIAENGEEVVGKMRATWAENGQKLDRAFGDLKAIRNGVRAHS